VVIERVRYLESHFQVADDTAAVTGQLVRLMGDFRIGGKQVHDANIVATMQAQDIPCLLTYNIDDFKRFDTLIRIEPIDSSKESSIK
jgi:predicted nucleic acid-binding protein